MYVINLNTKAIFYTKLFKKKSFLNRLCIYHIIEFMHEII